MNNEELLQKQIDLTNQLKEIADKFQSETGLSLEKVEFNNIVFTEINATLKVGGIKISYGLYSEVL